MPERPGDEAGCDEPIAAISALEVLALAGLTADDVYAAHASAPAAPTDPLEHQVQDLARRVSELERRLCQT